MNSSFGLYLQVKMGDPPNRPPPQSARWRHRRWLRCPQTTAAVGPTTSSAIPLTPGGNENPPMRPARPYRRLSHPSPEKKMLREVGRSAVKLFSYPLFVTSLYVYIKVRENFLFGPFKVTCVFLGFFFLDLPNMI